MDHHQEHERRTETHHFGQHARDQRTDDEAGDVERALDAEVRADVVGSLAITTRRVAGQTMPVPRPEAEAGQHSTPGVGHDARQHADHGEW